jgi:hypothetical protein
MHLLSIIALLLATGYALKSPEGHAQLVIPSKNANKLTTTSSVKHSQASPSPSLVDEAKASSQPNGPAATQKPGLKARPASTNTTAKVKLLSHLHGGDDCTWAGKYQPWTYLDCQSSRNTIRGSLDYTIRMTGTGQQGSEWCNTFYRLVSQTCRANVIPISRCGTSNLTRQYALDGDNFWTVVALNGIEMNFRFYNTASLSSDDGHLCVSHALRFATCSQVEIANGAHCVALGYYNETYQEYSVIQGPSSARTFTPHPGQVIHGLNKTENKTKIG